VIETVNYQNYSTAQLIGLLQQKDLHIQQNDEQIQHLRFRLDNLERALFGKSSERHVPAAPIINQPALFETEPVEQNSGRVKTTVKEYNREKALKDKEHHNGRNAFPKNIERVEVIIEPDGDLSGYKCIGEDKGNAVAGSA